MATLQLLGDPCTNADTKPLRDLAERGEFVDCIEVTDKRWIVSGPNPSMVAPPAVIVIFGAGGDPTKRKLLPALR
jgi:hypothetical protein